MYLLCHHSAVKFSNGGTKNLGYIYDDEPMVIFDYNRSNEDHLNYSILESFKNGYITSEKCESCNKIFLPPSLVCFANFAPDRSNLKLSEDRWMVFELNDQEQLISM